MAKLGATSVTAPDAVCDLYKSANQSVGAGFSNLTFTSAALAATNGTRGVLRNFTLAGDNVTITIGQTGVYLLNARVKVIEFGTNATLTVRSNSTAYELASKSVRGADNVGTHITLTQVVYLVAGESLYVQVYVPFAATVAASTATNTATGITIVKLGRTLNPTLAATTHIDAAAAPYAPDGTRSYAGGSFSGTGAQMGGWTSNSNVDPLTMTQFSGGYYPGIALPTAGWWWLRTSTNFWGEQASAGLAALYRYGFINANGDLFYNTTIQNYTNAAGNQYYSLCETSAIVPFNAGAAVLYGFSGPNPYYVTSYATSGKTDAQAVYLGPL